MLRIEPVGDVAPSDLEPYTTLRRRKDLTREARFVAEGGKVVERLLRSTFPVESLLVTQERLARVRDLLDARGGTIRVFLARDRVEIAHVTGFPDREGIKAVGRVRHAITIAKALWSSERPCLFVALDGITNAENVGVIARNAAALGVGALVVGETTCSPFLTRAIGASMGAVFALPVVEHLALLEALARLRSEGVRLIAAHPAATRALHQVDLRGESCIVLGSEGDGISPQVLAACDDSMAVPMSRGVDSLNVGSAAAVVLYEAMRQRSRPRQA